jgi:putative transposase
MTNIRRYWKSGQAAFLTHVTHNRFPILVKHFDLLWPAIQKEMHPPDFGLVAWVALPDHLHMLVEYDKADLSLAVRRFKLSFSSALRPRLGLYRTRIWQNRFWDHIIRDDRDFRVHFDYIHYNPVKHGLTNDPHEYTYSSFSQFVANGHYQSDWGVTSAPMIVGEFGE